MSNFHAAWENRETVRFSDLLFLFLMESGIVGGLLTCRIKTAPQEKKQIKRRQHTAAVRLPTGIPKTLRFQ